MMKDDREKAQNAVATFVRSRGGLIAWALAALTLVTFAPITWLYASTAEYRYPPGETPKRPVAMVLGAGVTPSGQPTRLLARRLNLAADLYHSGRVEVVLVTGDNSLEHYNETDAMRSHLIREGVPETRIVGDYAGFSTWESCVRAKEVFGVESVTVITQSFHLPRSVALCRAVGLDAIGVGDPAWGGDRNPVTLYGHVREVPAAIKAVFDLLLRPDPTFLGPYETSVEEALAAEK